MAEQTKEEVVEQAEELESSTEQTPDSAPEPPSETEQLQANFQELQDKYLRLAAEYENFRKRSQRERETVYNEAISHAVKALLPTFDNLERALSAPTQDEDYKKGVELTFRQLLEALQKLNVKPISDEAGTPFDPNQHNAVMHIEDETLGENVIAECFQRGFTLDDKVIRHSMVKVAN